MLDLIIMSIGFVASLILLDALSKRAVDNLERLAYSLKLSPLLIGIFLVSIGTNIPELITSLLSSYMGEGDIIVGDGLGAVFDLVTLALGILPLVGAITLRKIKFRRKDVGILGLSLIISLLVLLSILQTGFISRLNALILLVTYISISLLHLLTIPARFKSKKEEIEPKSPFYYIAIATLQLFGVGLAAFVAVKSVVFFSQVLRIPKYIISFFILAIGTTLPEMVVNIAALRKGCSGIILGNVMGSCIIDSTLVIALGPLFFPVKISTELAMRSGVYVLGVSTLVTLTLYANKGKLTPLMGVLFLFLFLIILPYSLGVI